MINPNELRIGNYCNEISRRTEIHLPTIAVFQIVEIHLFGVEAIPVGADILKTKYHTIRTSDLSPIPLTPEILEKFGFEKNGSKYRIGNFYIFDYDHVFGFDVNDDIGCNIKYLHQLQNLYFALTGEELTKPNEWENVEFSILGKKITGIKPLKFKKGENH